MNDNIITLIKDSFMNSETGNNVDAITIIIDGKLKDVLDLILVKNSNYNDYMEILRDAIFDGVNNIIKSTQSM